MHINLKIKIITKELNYIISLQLNLNQFIWYLWTSIFDVAFKKTIPKRFYQILNVIEYKNWRQRR